MKAQLLDRVTNVGIAAAQLEAGVERVKGAVADALEDGIDAAKRALKQGRRATMALAAGSESIEDLRGPPREHSNLDRLD